MGTRTGGRSVVDDVDHEGLVAIRKSLESIKTGNKESGGHGRRRRRQQLCREVSNLSVMSNQDTGYHAEKAAAVPFVWESRPGTPKRHSVSHSHYFSSSSNNCHKITISTTADEHYHHHNVLIPPLTPPPSYHSTPTTPRTRTRQPPPAASNINLIQSMFPRLSLKKDPSPRHPPPAASSSSPASSSSSSLSLSTSSSRQSSSSPPQTRSVPSSPLHIRSSRRHNRKRLSFDSRPRAQAQAEDEDYNSSIKTGSTNCSSNGRFQGCYPAAVFSALRRRPFA